MYSPDQYKVDDLEAINELIDAESFATMISPALPEPVISHLPFLIDKSDPAKPKLLGHMARANPHWKLFSRNPSALLIFNGPHAYISPAWYEEKDGNVPTWNYAVVHVRGTVRVIEVEAAATRVIRELVEHFESKYDTNWKLDMNTDQAALMKAIVVFELTDLSFEAKFKLSQKHSDVNRRNVIEALAKDGQAALARYMMRAFD